MMVLRVGIRNVVTINPLVVPLAGVLLSYLKRINF
jgi:hypothetical protein